MKVAMTYDQVVMHDAIPYRYGVFGWLPVNIRTKRKVRGRRLLRTACPIAHSRRQGKGLFPACRCCHFAARTGVELDTAEDEGDDSGQANLHVEPQHLTHSLIIMPAIK